MDDLLSRIRLIPRKHNYLALDSPLAGSNPGTSGLDVRDGAVFEGQWVSLIDNEYIGLLAHRLGVAHLLYSRVGPTHAVEAIPEFPFGHAVAAVLEGAVAMTGF